MRASFAASEALDCDGQTMAATILIAAAVFFFPAAMALAASMDVVTMTIPNRVSAALAVGYFVLALAFGLPAQTRFGIVIVTTSIDAARAIAAGKKNTAAAIRIVAVIIHPM